MAISGASKAQTIQDRARAALERADKKLKTKPDDLDARLARALANLSLGENQKALDDLQVVIGKYPESIPAKRYKVIALARLGKKQDALSELAKFKKEDATESSKLYLAAVLAAELGEGADKALEALEAAIKKQPKDADLRDDAARALSLASKAISRTDKTKGRQLADRCLQLLKEAVKNGDADFGKMDEDADLDPIRDDPAFADDHEGRSPRPPLHRRMEQRCELRGDSDLRRRSRFPVAEVPGANLPGLSPGVAHGDSRPIRWTVGDCLGLAPPRGQRGIEGSPCGASGKGSDRPGPNGQS